MQRKRLITFLILNSLFLVGQSVRAYEQGTYFIFDLLGSESIAAASRIRVDQPKVELAVKPSSEPIAETKKSEFEIDFSQLITSESQPSNSLLFSGESALSGIKSTSSLGNTVSATQLSAFQQP